MTRSLPLIDRRAPGAASEGLWRVAGDALMFEEGAGAGPPVILVPGEEVLLLTAALPVQGQRRRAEALPFAIEERIAQPLSETHIALGVETAPQTYLAGAVSHAAMARWAALAAAAGLETAALVPDVLALPVPPEGSWGVAVTEGRARVRLADGTGFVLPEAQLAIAAQAAGVTLLPAGPPDPALLDRPALDLRQGGYARPRTRLSSLWRRAAWIAGAGLAAHGAIAAVDTLALRHIAAVRTESARATLARVAPAAAASGDLAGAVNDLLPAGGSAPSRFLPLLARASLALKPLAPAASLRSVDFNAASDSLALEVEAPDLATLQRVAGVLTGAGLNAQAGAATQAAGRATGTFLIRGSA